MQLNLILRHELHGLIKRASPDQLFNALHSPTSPIRDRFIRFLALSYADWLATQSDIEAENIKNEWKEALQMEQNSRLFSHTTDGEVDSKTREEHAPLSPTITPHTEEMNGRKENSEENHKYHNGPSKAMSFSTVNSNATALREKKPLDGFLKLSEREAKPVETVVVKRHSLTRSSPHTNTFSDDQLMLGNEDAELNGGNVQKLFDDLTAEQRALIKSKLPLLTDITSVEKRNDIIIKKLQLCCAPFNFETQNVLELKGIEKKKQHLTEILEYIARYAWYSEPVLQQCVKTISKNLFRALPRRRRNPEIEDEPFEDPAWEHLQLVYDLTLRLVICTDVDKKIMRKYLEGRFVDNIIELFSSDDAREREYLKTILHRIYGRFMPLRLLIRQSIANCCYRTIYEQSRPENGIAEFLEIFCSIIHGFSVPVKKEHKDFLRNVLVPLHKCRKLEKFHEQLVACCVQFVFKDPTVAPVILGGLLKFWPLQSPTKEEMFIAEVVNVINAMINHRNGFRWQDNREISLAIINRLVQCMRSEHHSVAERALLVWSEDAVEILVDYEKKTIWPKIVGAFMENKNHWNESLRECNEDAMDGFRVRDHSTFHKIREDYLKNKQAPKEFAPKEPSRGTRLSKWKQLNNIANRNGKPPYG